MSPGSITISNPHAGLARLDQPVGLRLPRGVSRPISSSSRRSRPRQHRRGCPRQHVPVHVGHVPATRRSRALPRSCASASTTTRHLLACRGGQGDRHHPHDGHRPPLLDIDQNDGTCAAPRGRRPGGRPRGHDHDRLPERRGRGKPVASQADLGEDERVDLPGDPDEHLRRRPHLRWAARALSEIVEGAATEHSKNWAGRHRPGLLRRLDRAARAATVTSP